MTKERKQTMQFIVAAVLVAFGCLLIGAGFVADPMGEIHPSVLAAFGELLTFSGAIIGIDYKYRYKHEED